MGSRHEGNHVFRGIVQFFHIILPTGCVADKHVAADAAVQVTKLQHQHRAVYAQESATTAAAETRTVHVVHGTGGLVKTIKFGSVVACLLGATITIDLLKNGVSILDAAIVLDSGDSAYDLVAGVIDTEAVVAGDVLEIDITVAAGGGTIGVGVFGYVDIYEDAA